MKKILLTLVFSLAALIGGGGIYAEEISVTFSEQGYTNAQEVQSLTVDNVTFAFNKGTGSTTPKYYNSGTAFRLYAKNTMTISVPDNFQITNVVMTTGSSNTINSASTADNGTLTIDGTTGTISDINSTSVTFTQGGTSGHVRITNIVVTYESTGEQSSVTTPVITPNSGEITADTEISISCSTANATIYYTTDGTEPSNTNGNEYTAAFKPGAATTVKAIAYADGLEASKVTTAEYTFPYADINEFIMAANSTAATISGTVTVVAQSGSYLFVQDESAKIIVFGSLNNTYSNGDRLTGIKGTYTNYNGLPEMYPEASSFGTATAGTAIEPVTITLNELADTQLLTYVKITGVTIPDGSSNAYTITDTEGNSATMYNTLGMEVTAGENLTVTGFVSCYNTTIQLMPLEITSASGMEVASAPEISPNGGTIDRATEISITSASENVSIYYTLDGTSPSAENGTLYTAPFTLNEEATVRAIAVGENYENSTISEAAFTLLGENTYIVTYDFTNPDGLNPAMETPATSAGIAVNDILFTNGLTGMICTKNSASTDCRLWGTNSGTELRTYKNSTIAITGSSAKIIAVTFEGGKASASYMSADKGTFTVSSWTADDEVNSVIFTATGTTNITGIKVTYEIQPYTLSVSNAGWATLMLGFNAEIPENVEVYTASIDGTTATLSPVTDILPANTAVIVRAEQGDYTFNYTSSEASFSGTNALQGTLHATTLTPGDNNYYVLANGTNDVGLYIVDDNTETEGYEAFTLGANKAYLGLTSASSSASYSFRIEGTTAIEGVEAAEEAAAVIYDLTGRRIDAATAPGIYIVNGKKVVVK